MNDDATSNSQFFPSIEVDANDRVNVGFYDRRDDPGDVKSRYYVARNLDGCATPNAATASAAAPAMLTRVRPSRHPPDVDAPGLQ